MSPRTFIDLGHVIWPTLVQREPHPKHMLTDDLTDQSNVHTDVGSEGAMIVELRFVDNEGLALPMSAVRRRHHARGPLVVSSRQT